MRQINAAFQFETNKYGKQWSNMGYLSQMEWGYALALFAYLRGENEPAWHKYLTKSVASDFRQGQRFIYQNEERLFEG
ncbi:MAG: hypothetical protein JSS76_02025 [Bacteroidetes bacterium]|nr:hypothetical protein [Bacteroidota bacterium]